MKKLEKKIEIKIMVDEKAKSIKITDKNREI